MKLLDLFCKAGGASTGYHRAGFEITGVDIQPQKNYPFEFIQSDAITYLSGIIKSGEVAKYNVIAASPPCQGFSCLTPEKYKSNHPNLIPAVRELMLKTGLPYAIENVEGAKSWLRNPIMLCGSMFGLPIWRHRYFETNLPDLQFAPATCNHGFAPILVSGTTTREPGRKFEFNVADCKRAMGIDWMTRKELDEAIPPAYTEWLGGEILKGISE